MEDSSETVAAKVGLYDVGDKAEVAAGFEVGDELVQRRQGRLGDIDGRGRDVYFVFKSVLRRWDKR